MKIEFRFAKPGLSHFDSGSIDGEPAVFTHAEARIEYPTQYDTSHDDEFGNRHFIQRQHRDHALVVLFDGVEHRPDELVLHHDESWTRYRCTPNGILIEAYASLADE